jgi:hypothetical protein
VPRKNHDEGGAAFPGATHNGMSLRDYYAGKAMQGLLASMPPNTHVSDGLADLMSVAAFRVADKMIAERDR